MTRPALPLVLLLVWLAAVGCSQKRSYEITISNQTDQPVTLWLTKDGPPDEPGWRTPEWLAINTFDPVEVRADAVVPPGQVRTLGPFVGRFKRGTSAVLRIYRGELDFYGVLATGWDHLLRDDVILDPGPNKVVVEQKPALRARRLEE